VNGDFVGVGWRRSSMETVSVVKSEKPTKLINRDHVAIDLVKHAEKGFKENLDYVCGNMEYQAPV
jgi:hypothetical protein